MNKALMVGLIAIVAGALIGGFMVVGGPGYARLEKQDMQRASDLQDLFRFLQCRSYEKVLPETLADEEYCPDHVRLAATKDPATGDPYVYRRLDDQSFEICATFATEAQKGNSGYPYRALEFNGQIGCRKGVTVSPQRN